MEGAKASEKPAMDNTTTTTAGLNPLEVPLILENIFSFLGHQDLNACRQVSKLWNTYSQKAWNASGPVHITCGKGRPGSNATEFVKFVRKRGMDYRRSLYTNFTLRWGGGIKPFWNVCGPNIKVLSLVRCQFASVDDFRNVIYKLCPSMKELKLDYVFLKRVRRHGIPEPSQWTAPQFGEHRSVTSLTSRVCLGSIPVSWMEILSHFPNLKVLNLEGTLSAVEGYGGELFKSLALIRLRNPTDLKVRNPHFPVNCYACYDGDALPPELVTGVQDSKLHLESLFVCMNGANALADLRSVLISNAGSLKKLQLSGRVNRDRDVVDLDESFRPPNDATQLTNLQEIDLDTEGFASLAFLRFIPNLKKLSLACRRQMKIVENTSMMEMEGVELESCSELNIKGEISTEDLQKLILWMPNVTKFGMRMMDDAQSELVRVYWPNVRN